MTDPDELVLAISNDDTVLHVGSAHAVRGHLLRSRPIPPRQPGELPGAVPAELIAPPSQPDFAPHALRLADIAQTPLPAGLQLFDARGQRLTLTGLAAQSTFRAVIPADVVPEAVMLARITAALDHMDALLAHEPELGNDPPRQHAEVPRPQGCTLPEVLAELEGFFFPLDPDIASNRGNWLHNLAHAAGLI